MGITKMTYGIYHFAHIISEMHNYFGNPFNFVLNPEEKKGKRDNFFSFKNCKKKKAIFFFKI